MSSDIEENRNKEIERKRRQKLLIDIIDAIRAAHIARLALARSLVVHKIDHGSDGGMMIPARVDEPVEEVSSDLHPTAESTLFFLSMMYLPLIVAGIFVEPITEYEKHKKLFQLLDAVVWTGINLIRFNGAGAAALKLGITAALTPVVSIILLLGGYVFDLLNQWYFDNKNKEDQTNYKAQVETETHRIQTLQNTLANGQIKPLAKLKALLTDDDSVIKNADHRSASDDAKAIEKELKTRKEQIRKNIIDHIRKQVAIEKEVTDATIINGITDQQNQLLFTPIIQSSKMAAQITEYQEILALEQINYEKSKKELQEKIDHFYNFSLRWNILYAIGLSSGAFIELLLLTTAIGLAPLGFAVITASTAINQLKNLFFTIKDYLDVRSKCQEKIAFLSGAAILKGTLRNEALAATTVHSKNLLNAKLINMGLKPIADFGKLEEYISQQTKAVFDQQDEAFSKMCLHVSWYSFVLTTMACLVFVANPLVGFAVFATCIIAYTAFKASKEFKLEAKGSIILNCLLGILIAAAIITLCVATGGAAAILIPIAAATLALSTSAAVGHNTYMASNTEPVKKILSCQWFSAPPASPLNIISNTDIINTAANSAANSTRGNSYSTHAVLI